MKWFRKNKIKNNPANMQNNAEITNISELIDIFKNGNVPVGDLASATYYACMLIRCNAVAKLPCKVMQSVDDFSNVKHDHPLHYLLNVRPNQFQTPHDFLWATEFQRLHYGNAYWVKEMQNGKLKNLYLLDSKAVSVIYDDAHILSERTAVYYQYTDSRNGVIYYSSDDIVHFRNFSPDGIVGTPIKRYLSDVIGSEKYGRNVVKSKFKDGLQDPILVQYTGDLNHEIQAKIQKKFESLGGAKNAGKVIPIPKEFSVQQLTTNLVNSQFFDLQNLTAKQIANAFGVKSFQLNDMEKSTYANITEQNKAFYSDTIQNVLTAYEQEINYKLFYYSEITQGYFVKFNVDVMLRSDITSRYAAYRSGIEGGFLQIAEVRKKENLPFVDGTDKLIIGNGASIPLDDLGSQYIKKEE